MREEASADAPGRVNLIGEHTDYHDGFVLPTIIPQRTRAHVRARADRTVHAHSRSMTDAIARFELGSETRRGGWIDYVQGVTTALARRGYNIGGFDLDIASTVPIGAGVASSAALEVSLLRALRLVFDLPIDDVTLAVIARSAETDFVGAPIGIMDQMAASLGRDGEAMLLDTRTLAADAVPLPSAIDIIVIDSGVTHAHAVGAYAARRRESFEAAARLGVERLRDVDLATLPRIDALPPLLARRGRHVVTENARVLEAVAAMRAGDARRLGRLFAASHASMRDDYEISTADVDALVALADGDEDVFGSRLTGGGFGGAVVILARAGSARAASARIRDAYCRRTGRRAAVLVPPER